MIQFVCENFSLTALAAAGWCLGVTLLACVLLVLTNRWHCSLSMDHTEGVQKFHSAPTPRIGGIPIVLGLLLAWFKAPAEVREIIQPLLVDSLPAFTFGLAEDLTKRM